MEEHPDREVQAAIVRLADALCSWERATGMENVLIVKQMDGWRFRAMNGKPNVPSDVDDDDLLDMMA